MLLLTLVQYIGKGSLSSLFLFYLLIHFEHKVSSVYYTNYRSIIVVFFSTLKMLTNMLTKMITKCLHNKELGAVYLNYNSMTAAQILAVKCLNEAL